MTRKRKNKQGQQGLVGLKGEVFNGLGQVMFSAPQPGPLQRSGIPGAIPYEITHVIEATHDCPAWVDVQVAGQALRLGAQIVQPPWFRFADCVYFAHVQRAAIPISSLDEPSLDEREPCRQITIAFPPAPHPHSVRFRVWRYPGWIQIDTEERVMVWNPQAG